MPSACGVTWSGTASGSLDESAIPNDDFESHYLNDGETKSDSSFPVVDSEGNLRAGNVNSAWDLRGQGEGASEDCLRRLASAFDENPLPESAMENSTTVTLGDNETDGKFGMNLEFNSLPTDALSDGFNRHGVRENDDGSVDVRFAAMEPGERRGFEITPEFLRNVTSYEYGRIPVQLDHSDSQRANVGYVKGDKTDFTDGVLKTQVHIPNTGSSVRDDIIADFTHDPPQINDISVSFDPRTVELDPPDTRGEAPTFVDGKIREFSLTPFPAGYDNGGLTPEFSSAVEQASITPEEFSEPESKLITRPHILIKK